jgi:SRSO17 transposase
MLPIVQIPHFIEQVLPRFSSTFNKSQLRHFAEYLTGLIVSENKTVTGINDNFLGHTDQSCKNNFLTSSDWNEEKLTEERARITKEHIQKTKTKNGILVIDDTLSHKTGEKIEGVDYFFDHRDHCHTLAHQLISSQFITKRYHLPLNWRLYEKESKTGKEKFKSKLDLAIELIEEAISWKIPFSIVVADSWYFCQKIIDCLACLSKFWIFASKSNRKVSVNGKWMKLSDYVKILSSDCFKKLSLTKADGQTVDVWSFPHTLRMHKVGRVKVVISFLKCSLKDNPFYLVTNKKEWPMEKILACYLKRWPIETFYRDAKQHLGLEDCEMRLMKGIRRHWSLLFLAYTLLQTNSTKGSLYRWLKANVVTIGGKCQMAAGEILRSFIFWAYGYFQKSCDAEEVFKIAMSKNRQHRPDPLFLS